MTIKEFCKKYGLTEDQFYGHERYEGNLYLGSLTSIPEGFNPTVGGNLDLGSLTSIPEGFNPTVGGYLHLGRGLKAVTQPFHNQILFWQDGKYCLVDEIFTEVIAKKGRVYTVRKIGRSDVQYLVTDGKSTHAHGETLEQAKTDLRFKRIADKLKNDPIKADTVITVPYYRAITGACEFGVKDWMDKVFTAERAAKILAKGIKAKDLLPILEKHSAYGSEKFRSLVTFK